MKNITAVGLCVVTGVVLFKVGKAAGYTEGAMDVLVKNDIDSFTKEYKNGYTVTIAKTKKEGK